MTFKMIATDLDGTLLDSHKQIMPHSIAALESAKKLGIKIVLTSSRPLSGIRPFLNKLYLNGNRQYAILYNGGLIQDLDGKIIATADLNYDDFKKFAQIWAANDIHCHFETLTNFLTLDHHLSLQMARNSELTRMPILIKKRADFTPAFHFLKSEFTGTAGQIVKFKQNLPSWFTEEYSVVQSNAFTLAVTSKQASKGAAVKQLAQRLGFPQNEVIIFGDEGNDLSMFKNPHFFKVAMKNGIPSVRARANYITQDNNHDGVGAALDKFVLNE